MIIIDNKCRINTKSSAKRKLAIEGFIIKDGCLAYEYAWFVFEYRWIPGEKAILGDPYWAMAYADDVLRSRWPEAEDVISSDARASYFYAKNVICGRWPKAEPTICKSEHWKQIYVNLLHTLGLAVVVF